MTEDEYHEHENSCDGYCTACEDWTRMGDTEPDAEDYECPVCGEKTCIGTMVALERGLVDID